MEVMLGLLLAVTLGYAVVHTNLRRWAGGWRMAAALPLPYWAVWVVTFARDLGLDPTPRTTRSRSRS